jgi:2'-5' RNA ligase
MLRLFTGLEIPSTVAGLLSGLRGGLHGARWIDPENYHITLRFIGDIDERTGEEIAEALTRVRRPGVAVRLSGLGSFGGAKPHALWARVEPSPLLAELQAEHERILQRLGLPPEGRKYTPHVTLARLRGTPPGELAGWLALNGGFQIPPFLAHRFALFSARASVGGGPYLVEETFPLAV